VNRFEILRLESYLREKFGNPHIALNNPRNDGSVEVNIGTEFIGVIYRDDEDGEVSYAFHMAIIETDLSVHH
jgi:hypothetical protein